MRGRPGRRGRRTRKAGAAGGQLSSRPRLLSGRRTSRPQLYIRRGATGGSLELFGQSSIPYGKLCTSASDFGKRPSPAQERQSRTAIPWPYVVSSGRPKGGIDEYPTRFAGNL